MGTRKKREIISLNESRKYYQDSIVGAFAEKTEILKKEKVLKEKMKKIIIGKQKRDVQVNVIGRLMWYTKNLAKVNKMIEDGKFEFGTMDRRYEAEIEGEMDTVSGMGLVQKKETKHWIYVGAMHQQ